MIRARRAERMRRAVPGPAARPGHAASCRRTAASRRSRARYRQAPREARPTADPLDRVRNPRSALVKCLARTGSSDAGPSERVYAAMFGSWIRRGTALSGSPSRRRQWPPRLSYSEHLGQLAIEPFRPQVRAGRVDQLRRDTMRLPAPDAPAARGNASARAISRMSWSFRGRRMRRRARLSPDTCASRLMISASLSLKYSGLCRRSGWRRGARQMTRCRHRAHRRTGRTRSPDPAVDGARSRPALAGRRDNFDKFRPKPLSSSARRRTEIRRIARSSGGLLAAARSPSWPNAAATVSGTQSYLGILIRNGKVRCPTVITPVMA